MSPAREARDRILAEIVSKFLYEDRCTDCFQDGFMRGFEEALEFVTSNTSETRNPDIKRLVEDDSK